MSSDAALPRPRVGRRPAVLVALAWPLVAWAILDLTAGAMLASVIAFLVVPSIVLAALNPAPVASALVFSAAVGGSSIIWIDEIATLTGQWKVIDPVALRLPLVEASVQSALWAVAHFLVSVLAWEAMTGPRRRMRRPGRRLAACAAAFGLLAVFLAVKATRPEWLAVPYFYLGFGMLLIALPVAAAAIARPWMRSPLALLAVAGFWWKLIYEIAALRGDWWRFPGDFIGWIAIGACRIPVEEFVFWLILFSPAIAVFWEFWSEPRSPSSAGGATPVEGG